VCFLPACRFQCHGVFQTDKIARMPSVKCRWGSISQPQNVYAPGTDSTSDMLASLRPLLDMRGCGCPCRDRHRSNQSLYTTRHRNASSPTSSSTIVLCRDDHPSSQYSCSSGWQSVPWVCRGVHECIRECRGGQWSAPVDSILKTPRSRSYVIIILESSIRFTIFKEFGNG
jgi:hypothetical protein